MSTSSLMLQRLSDGTKPVTGPFPGEENVLPASLARCSPGASPLVGGPLRWELPPESVFRGQRDPSRKCWWCRSAGLC